MNVEPSNQPQTTGPQTFCRRQKKVFLIHETDAQISIISNLNVHK